MKDVKDIIVYTTYAIDKNERDKTITRMSLHPMDCAPNDCCYKEQCWNFRAIFSINNSYLKSCLGITERPDLYISENIDYALDWLVNGEKSEWERDD